MLKKNGVFIISTPNRNRFFNFLMLLLRLRTLPYYEKTDLNDNDPYAVHVKEYTDNALQQLLALAGFKINKIHRVFYGITGGLGFTYFLNLPFFHNIILESKKSETA